MTMRLPALLLALALAGCASTRPPGTLPPPVTLAQVNAALAGERATVYYADGTSERAYVEIGPELSTVRPGRTARAVPTAQIAQVEIDDSMTPGEGAVRGLQIGAGPGAIAFGAGVLLSAVDERPTACFICISAGEAIAILGVLGGAAGAVIGPTVGAISTSPEYPVTVYRAPITRYPDAAAELRAAAPDSAPTP